MKSFLKKNKTPSALLLLSVAISIFFFIKRNNIGSFIDYTSYPRLYSPKSNNFGQKLGSVVNSDEVKEKLDARILAFRNAGISENSPAIDKMAGIGKWLVKEFKTCPVGKPEDSVSFLPMLKQYEFVVNKKTPIWCGTYAAMFLFFCKACDIECRMIEFFNPGDHHVVNECYIPGLNKWIAIDLTYNFLFLKNDKGEYLNTLDLLEMVRDNKIITTFRQSEDSISQSAFSGYNFPWRTYLNPMPDIYFYKETRPSILYAPKEKIKRYIWPSSFAEIYSENRKSNLLFFIRLFFLWISLSLFVYLFYRLMRK